MNISFSNLQIGARFWSVSTPQEQGRVFYRRDRPFVFECPKCHKEYNAQRAKTGEWAHFCPAESVNVKTPEVRSYNANKTAKWISVVAFREEPRESPKTAKGEDLAKFTHRGDAFPYVARLLGDPGIQETYTLIVVR